MRRRQRPKRFASRQVEAALALAVNARKPALGGDLHFDPFRLGGTAGLDDAAWLMARRPQSAFSPTFFERLVITRQQ